MSRDNSSAVPADTGARLERARAIMAREKVDLLLVSPSADLKYLIGYGGHPSERPTLLVISADTNTYIVMPRLEAPRLAGLGVATVVAYEETYDPYGLLCARLPNLAALKRAALSDRTWAVVLMRLQEAMPHVTFSPAGALLREMRMLKSPAEIELLHRAGAMADAAFAEIVSRPFAGRSERAVAEELGAFLRQQGLEAADWGPTVASGPNSSSPHHMTGSRVIQGGEPVIMDFGGVLEGYQADITRTVHVGRPNDEVLGVYDAVREAQQAGVSAVGPGVRAEMVDLGAREIIESHGYGQYFVHRTGHGIGLDTHEEPYIVAGNSLLLEPGMSFSVEPGVYLPGRFGVRIEDAVATTTDGVLRLNEATRDLVIVD